METINYKNHPISFSNYNEKFAVIINGSSKYFPSVASAKRAVDKALEAIPFKQFQVATIIEGKPQIVTIVGSFEKKGWNRGSKFTVFKAKLSNNTAVELSHYDKLYDVKLLDKITKLHNESNRLDKLYNKYYQQQRTVDRSLNGLGRNVQDYPLN